MDKHDYKQNAFYLIYLIRCVLNGRTPSRDKLDKMDLSQLYKVAEAHSLTAIASYALASAGVCDKAFEESQNMSIRRSILFDAERASVCEDLEEQGIWYMPLKGAILKDIYPRLGMRQMADNDILFDMERREDVRNIMAEHGFELKAERDVVDEYQKEPIYNFEMHGELFMEYQVGAMADYYRSIKSRIIKDADNGYGYHLSDEDFYLFMVAHEYKHFTLGGTGIRSLVDVYVYINRYGKTLDWEYIAGELEKIGIRDYEKRTRELAMKLFEGVRLSDDEKTLLDSFIISGTYGSIENKVNRGVKENGGKLSAKLRYAASRFAVPVSRKNKAYLKYEKAYPFFYRHKFLLPLLPFYRVFSGLIFRRSRVFSEIKTIIRMK